MNSGLAKGPHHALSKRAKLAGINRSPAQSPDWCGENPLGPPEVKTRTLLVETRPTSAQIVGRSVDARNKFSLLEERIRSWRIEEMPQQSIIPTLSGFAQAIERIGLAIVGALCGFYVAALVARANNEAINSVGVLFPVVLFGSIGFYLGTNIPSLPSGAARRAPSESGSAPRTNPIALASSTGTFLAAVAALVSVYMIVFDEVPPVIWNIGIGFWWMLGVLLQLAAGTAARLG
jgi:hypothetical protein